MLYLVGFREALFLLAGLVLTALISTALLMKGGLGTSNRKAKFAQMFSNNRAVNVLAAARVFLFASRDVWFVVGLPVFLYTELEWTFWQVGGFMAIWIIGYGLVQASAPGLLRRRYEGRGGTPDGVTATWLAFMLAAFPAGIALALRASADPTLVVVAGLIAFGVVFALNSAVHSYLILAYTDSDKVAMNVGFYYMANACGRLAGTVLSGLLYQYFGLIGCLCRRRTADDGRQLGSAGRRVAQPSERAGIVRPAAQPMGRRADGAGTGPQQPVRHEHGHPEPLG